MAKETVVLQTSDWHYGKQTESYNLEVFEDRFQRLGGQLAELKERRNITADRLAIFMLGDICDGGGIYPTQVHHQIITDPNEQAWRLVSIVKPWLMRQQDLWGKVEIHAVVGNHGRNSRFAHENTNWDLVFYRYLSGELKGEMPIYLNEQNYCMNKVQIRDHNYLLYHGDEIYSTAGIPWYGVQNRLLRWNTSGALAPLDALCIGHFHSMAYWRVNQLHILETGTMVTDDQWSLKKLGFDSTNQWWLFGVSDRSPITWQEGLNLV
ncbi:MAG: hypothetical protein HF312_15730 [Ignavibacteria bacterium]|jgi:hypothetical protein|nr:hypothetical protein [Ignavibacteria bacterium]